MVLWYLSLAAVRRLILSLTIANQGQDVNQISCSSSGRERVARTHPYNLYKKQDVNCDQNYWMLVCLVLKGHTELSTVIVFLEQ